MFLKEQLTEQLKETLSTVAKDYEIKVEGLMFGAIKDVLLKDCKNKETQQPFQLVEIIVKTKLGDLKKAYSIDFLKKYLKQVDDKISEGVGAIVAVTKKNDRYKNIGYFAFCTVDAEGNPDISEYVDEAEAETLKKLVDLGI